MLGAMVLVLPVATVITVGSGAAFAAKSKGTLKCTAVTGTINFNPPLANGGTQNETITGALTISHCVKNSGKPKIPKHGTVTISGIGGAGTNNCASLEGTGPPSSITFTTKWTPSTISPSVASYSGYDIATQPGTGDEGFSLPNAAGPPPPSGTVTGSYATTASTALAYSNMTATQIANACAGAGLSSLTIDAISTIL